MTQEQLKRRYRDGYGTAKLISGIGTAVKILGLVLASGIAFLALAAGVEALKNEFVVSWLRENLKLSPHQQNDVLFYVCASVWGTIFIIFELIGMLISAAGQIMKAVFDTAVNTSPFLSTEEKEEVIPISWWHEQKREWRKLRKEFSSE